MVLGMIGSNFADRIMKFFHMISSALSQLVHCLIRLFRQCGICVVRIVLRRWPMLCSPADHLLSLVRSIPEQSLVSSVNRYVVDITTIRHAGFETYTYPSELPRAFRTEMHFARRHVYRMRDVCVNVHTGACCTEQNNFQESFGSVRRWLLNNPVSFQRSELLPIDGLTTCVHSTGYAHYLMEEVPRLLWTLQHYAMVNVLVPTRHSLFVASILSELKHLGHLKGEVIQRDEKVLTVNNFVFTQAEAYSGFWHADDLSLLRACFLPSDGQPEDNFLQIYISRLHSKRSYANEDAVEILMRSLGIKVIYLEDLEFIEQIKLFSQAKMIVSPHGGGLANLVWCSPGTNVIELFTSNIFNDCFARICSQLDCRYQPIWVSDLSAGGVVNLDILERVLL